MESLLKLPSLRYAGNEQKKMTLHLFLQIIGKIRLNLAPAKSHWWNATQYINARGITTGSIPYNSGLDVFEITLNVGEHQLEVCTSQGEYESFHLHDRLTVADFYQKLMTIIEKLNISVCIVSKPYDLGIKKLFAEITEYHHYDKNYTSDLWKSLIWINNAFEEFSGRFKGKTSPVHLHWHSMDLTVSLFSGNECINFEFWLGDESMDEPAFYSYASPLLNGLAEEALSPASAEWIDNNGSLKAMLKYNDLIKTENPKKELLEFLESAYRAGAKRANWDIEKFRVSDVN